MPAIRTAGRSSRLANIDRLRSKLPERADDPSIRPRGATLRAMIIGEDTRTFIDRQRVGHLATVDEHARPHIVPICFALRGDTVYIAVDEKPKTADYSRLR